MSTHKICLYKEVDKKYTGCNLKTTKLLDCALIGVCVVIRLNTVLIIHMLFQNGLHDENMLYNVDPINPTSIYWGLQGIHYFYYFCSKTWIVGTS